MFNIVTRFLLAATICAALTQTGRAQSDSIINSFNIDSLTVTHGVSPHPGDTVHLLVYTKAFFSGPASLLLHFPGSVAPPDQGVGETDRDSMINVDSGSG